MDEDNKIILDEDKFVNSWRKKNEKKKKSNFGIILNDGNEDDNDKNGEENMGEKIEGKIGLVWMMKMMCNNEK